MGKWTRRVWGEFGVLKEGCGIAPNCYTIDKNGNIYIADPVNAGVQIFDATGKYLREFQYTEKNNRSSHLGWQPYDIAVDANENIYILFYIHVGTFPGQSVEIKKYDKLGSFVESYPIPIELLGPTDEEIEAGMPSLIMKARLNSIIIEDNEIKVEGWFEKEYLKTDMGEKRRFTVAKGNRNLLKQEILQSSIVVTGELPKFPHLGYFLQKDEKHKHLYFTDREQIGEKDGWAVYQGILYKYDEEGRLLAILRYPLYKWGDIHQLFIDDDHARIYCLTNNDDGIQVIVYAGMR